jgi:hypothetical protein
MSTNLVPAPGSLSFWRIADVPFETCIAALGRLVRPTADYFRAGRLLLDSLTRSLPQRPEPSVTPSIAA